MTGMIRRVENSRGWILGRILIPGRFRRAACVAVVGAHHPELVDLGRHKVCHRCGTW